MYGDTEVMRRRVDRLREQAGDIRAEADQLVGRAESVEWTGRAADAMRARVKERAVALRAVAAQHEVAADALDKHLVAVAELKERIAEAEKAAGDSADSADQPADPAVLGSRTTRPPSGHKDWLGGEF